MASLSGSLLINMTLTSPSAVLTACADTERVRTAGRYQSVAGTQQFGHHLDAVIRRERGVQGWLAGGAAGEHAAVVVVGGALDGGELLQSVPLRRSHQSTVNAPFSNQVR